MRPQSIGLACALLGAVGFSFKAILVKAAYRYGVDPETLLALLLLGLLGYYASSYLDFLGLRHISAALERLILFVYPTIVVLYGAWRARRAPARPTVIALVLCYAAYLLGAAPLLTRLGSARVAAWATLVACIAALLQFVLLRPLALAVAQPWQVQALSAAMAVFSTVLPIWLVSEGIRRLGAAPTAMIGSLGPPITMLLAWLLLGEALGAPQLLGAALVIGGVRLVAAGES